MERNILNFRKTNHFLLRQWFRNIDDDILQKILSDAKLNNTNDTKIALIVRDSFLKTIYQNDKNVYCSCLKKHLVIICKSNILITLYTTSTTNDFDLLQQFKQYQTIIV